MQKIIVIIGLPGSGKTMYLKEHAQEFGQNALICDDYYKSAPGRTVEFKGSAYYADLREALKDGKNVVIADIVFCEEPFRREAEGGIKNLVAELGLKVDVDYRFFQNDPEACIANILNRARPERVASELKFIEEHRNNYRIPEGATILPVHR